MKRLRERVVAAVPETGKFEEVRERFVNQPPEHADRLVKIVSDLC